jgi:hypothetical protein
MNAGSFYGGGLPPFLSPLPPIDPPNEPPPIDLPFGSGEASALPFALLQLLKCTISLSGRNVLAQLGHASNALSLYYFIAFALYDSISTEEVFPVSMSSKFLGASGHGLRSFFGFKLYSTSHFFLHAFKWISKLCEPNSLPL